MVGEEDGNDEEEREKKKGTRVHKKSDCSDFLRPTPKEPQLGDRGQNYLNEIKLYQKAVLVGSNDLLSTFAITVYGCIQILPLSFRYPVFACLYLNTFSLNPQIRDPNAEQIIIIIIIIIIIAFRGAIRDFYNLLTAPRTVSNTYAQVAQVCKSRATHLVFITCKCHATCHFVRRGSSATKFERVEIVFI